MCGYEHNPLYLMKFIEQRFSVRGLHPLKHLLQHSTADCCGLKGPTLGLILSYINVSTPTQSVIFNINSVLSSHLRRSLLASFFSPFLIFHSFLISFMRATYLPSPSFVHPNDSGEQYKT
jgi:hypothetical protein